LAATGVTQRNKRRGNMRSKNFMTAEKIRPTEQLDYSYLNLNSIIAGLTVLSSLLQACRLLQMISLLPARVIKLLEFIGLSGSKVSYLCW
jgi:hypothetical protein